MVQSKTVLVIGSLNMDLVAKTERLPEKGETVFGKTFTTFPGGKGANQAVAAAKLGAKVAMAGCIGNDGFGSVLTASLQQNGVDTSLLRSVTTATGTALITVDGAGANTIVVVAGANNCCTINDVDRALASIAEPGILLVQHEIPEDVVEYAMKAAKQKEWTVILNPAPARPVNPDVLACVDIITPNETEIAALTGHTVVTIDDAAAAAGQLLAAGAKMVVVTMGDKGAVCVDAQTSVHIPPVTVSAVDTTAAGDAYTGAVAAALAEGMDLAAGLSFAAAAAALSVTRHGAQPAMPRRDEVSAFIAKREVEP